MLGAIPVVPESTAANRVDDYNENNNADVDESQQPPFSPYVVEHRSLARIAIEAQLFLDVAPCLAIRVGHCWTRFRHQPVGCVLELKPTVTWWLAASRL